YPDPVKVAVDQIAAAGLAVEVPRASGAPDRLLLKRGQGLRGTYAQDDGAIRLDAVLAEVLDLERVQLHAGESPLLARVVAMQGAAVDLRIVRGGGTSGDIRARVLDASAFDLSLGAERRFTVDELAGRDAELHLANGDFLLVASDLELSGAGLALEAVHIEW